MTRYTKVITYSTPSGDSINLTRQQEVAFERAGSWPRSPQGVEYCQVSHGLHSGQPTWTDDAVHTLTLTQGGIHD